MKGTRRSETVERCVERGVSIFSGIAFSGSLYYPFYTGQRSCPGTAVIFYFSSGEFFSGYICPVRFGQIFHEKLQKEKQSAACYDMIYGDSSCAAGKRGCIGKKERREKKSVPCLCCFPPLMGGNSERQVRIRQGIRILRKAEQVFPEQDIRKNGSGSVYSGGKVFK